MLDSKTKAQAAPRDRPSNKKGGSRSEMQQRMAERKEILLLAIEAKKFGGIHCRWRTLTGELP